MHFSSPSSPEKKQTESRLQVQDIQLCFASPRGWTKSDLGVPQPGRSYMMSSGRGPGHPALGGSAWTPEVPATLCHTGTLCLSWAGWLQLQLTQRWTSAAPAWMVRMSLQHHRFFFNLCAQGTLGRTNAKAVFCSVAKTCVMCSCIRFEAGLCNV